MTTSSDDLYAHFFDAYERDAEIARVEHEQARRQAEEKKAFRSRWMTAYQANRESPDFEKIAEQLLSLRGDLLSRFWDFRLSAFVSEGNRIAWNLAAVTLWHVSRDKKSAIQRGLARTASLLSDISTWHGEMYDKLTANTGLPMTPPINQSALARVIGANRYDVNNWYRHKKLTSPDTSGSAKRWLHEDDDVQKRILTAIRKKHPELIWPHGNT